MDFALCGETIKTRVLEEINSDCPYRGRFEKKLGWNDGSGGAACHYHRRVFRARDGWQGKSLTSLTILSLPVEIEGGKLRVLTRVRK